jgi:hypothetical protein
MRWVKISTDRRISDWFNLKSHSLSLYVRLLALDLSPMPAAHLNQPPTNTNKCMTLRHYDREIFCCCVSDDEIKSNSNWVFATWSSNKFWSGVPLCSHHKCDHLWSFLCHQLLLNFFHHQVSKPSSIVTNFSTALQSLSCLWFEQEMIQKRLHNNMSKSTTVLSHVNNMPEGGGIGL